SNLLHGLDSRFSRRDNWGMAIWAMPPEVSAMSDIQQLESRVAALERELADFKKHHAANGQREHWLLRMRGMFKDFEDFDEIVRLGREYRQSQTFEAHG
ncbi:MAG TPA: hypothetical protein VF175_03035, partial [Lacipirellula sp.]